MDQESAALVEVCRNALNLVQTAPRTITRIRLQLGDAVVEMEWAAVEVDDPAVTMLPAADRPAQATQPGGGGEAVTYIRAPMIGTFYHAPAADEPAFVQEGDVVEAGTQVGILEAMKLMNPIEADCAGRVAKVLVANGAPVEYDQPLIILSRLDDTGRE